VKSDKELKRNHRMKTTRRDFVKLTAAAGTGLIIAGVSSCQAPEGEISFTFYSSGRKYYRKHQNR
jgi:hypothetical protein